MPSALSLYDPRYDAWPDLRLGRIVLAPVRVGMDRKTGRMITGWKHVEQSLTVIFATRFHERVLRRWVGSFVPHLLGESAVERTVLKFYWAIAASIELWEPNYRVKKIEIATRGDRPIEDDDAQLTSPDELRMGHISTRNIGVYRPRAHLGDNSAEIRRQFGLIGIGNGIWETTPL
jgi:uncharacterized protein